MTTIGLIAILMAAGGTFYLMKKKEKENSREGLNAAAAKKAAQLRAQQENDLRIDNVKAGGILSFSNVGPQMISLDVQVTDKHLYKSGAYTWHELEGEGDTNTVYLTFEDNDLSLTLNAIPPHELNIDHDRFAQEPQDSLTYQGKKYHLDENGAATFCKSGNELTPEHFKYWDYETEDSSSYISVAQWQDGSLEITFAIPIKPHEVSVLSNG